MYFLLFKLPGWGKRFAVQPQAIDSEIPKIKSAFASKNKRQRHIVTSAVPLLFRRCADTRKLISELTRRVLLTPWAVRRAARR